MIITGFGSDRNGNAIVKIANDNETKRFSLQINQGQILSFTYSVRNKRIYQLTDKEKEIIEMEIRNYVRKFGTARQKSIVEYC